MTARRTGRSLVAAIALVLAAALPAAAANGTATGARPAGSPEPAGSLPAGEAIAPGIATFDGTTIDLSKGWGSARACIVPTGQEAECFATRAEAQAAAEAISQQEAASPAGATTANERRSSVATARTLLRGRALVPRSPCQGAGGEWLWLYQDSSYGGDSLGLQDVDIWWNLSDYGFADEMSSYSNDTGCEVYMVQNMDGSGPWLDVSPWAYSSYVGSAWNDDVVGVDIAY